MNLKTHTTAEINQKATNILYKHIGVVDTFRLFNQFSLGNGDYTQERKQWLDELSPEETVSDIKRQRK